MQKIVINKCYGGFGLSDEALDELEKMGIETYEGMFGKRWLDDELERDDPRLIKVVEELGKRASGDHANLKVVEIPDDVKWHIEDYDGVEWVAEDHRTWN